MFAPTSSSPPSGITRRTLRDNVAFELPVTLVAEAAAVGRAGVDDDEVGRLPMEGRCAAEAGRALIGGRFAGRGAPEVGTRLGAGRAFGVPRGLLIIVCFQRS